MGANDAKWPESTSGLRAWIKKHKLWLLAILLAGFLGAIVGCGPKPARAGDTGTLAMAVTAFVAGDTITVTTTFRPGADDGKGGLDGFIVRTGTNAGAPRALVDSVSLPASARSHTVRWIGNPVGSYGGFACVTARRRTSNSTPTCRSWTATVADVPPPPPIVDSVQVAAAPDSAWTGPPAGQVAFGYAPRWPRNPHMDEPVILGVAFPIPDSAGAVASAFGFCVARLTSAGRLVTRPPGTDWDARYRRYCEEYAERFWPGRTVVAYESATSAERAELAEYRCVHFLVECGDVSRCRKPVPVGCDSLGWRVEQSLDPRAFRVIGVVPRSA